MADIYLGSTDLSTATLKMGSSDVSALYQGSTLLWEPPTPYVTDGLTFYVDASDASSYGGSGTTWSDLSGNGNDLTIVSAPTFGGSGDAKYFDLAGNGDYFYTNSNVNLQQDFSVEIVLQTDVTNTLRYMATSGPSENSEGFHFIYRDNLALVGWGIAFYSNDTRYANAGAMTTGTWYHLVMTYKHSDGSRKFYINGVSQTQTSVGGTLGPNIVPAGPMYLGRISADCCWSQSSPTWDGKWALSRLYYKELSSAEVTTNFDGLSSRFGL